MRFFQRFGLLRRDLDLGRVLATSLVLSGHVLLVLLLQSAMSTPDLSGEVDDHADSVVALEFIAADALPLPMPAPAAPPLPPAAESARRTPRTPTPVAARKSSTSAVFLDDADVGGEAAPPAPRPDAGDAFDPAPAYKPFPQAPVLGSNLAKQATIRLPDRPSMLQAYWAVPEGENLKGRLVRKAPLVGLLLAATGGIGQPRCPPRSEHPDCLALLIEDTRP